MGFTAGWLPDDTSIISCDALPGLRRARGAEIFWTNHHGQQPFRLHRMKRRIDPVPGGLQHGLVARH
jgi:hypothetical protein